MLSVPDTAYPAAAARLSTNGQSRKRIADAFVGLLAYVQQLRTAGETPGYDEARQEILRQLKLSEEYPSQNACPWQDYDQARFAVCAWIDETVLAATWRHKSRWRTELLQRLYYQTTDAGELFFERLNSLGVHQNAIREVYYLCLALGFEGRYCIPGGAHTLQQLKSQHLKMLFEGWTETPTVAALEKEGLFPEAYAQTPVQPGPAPHDPARWMTAAVLAGSTFLLLALYLVYRFSLSSLGQNVIAAVLK